jgi:hypothetical protein
MTDKLDKLLRDDARVALPDEGFTSRVMAALPPRALRQGTWFKPLLIFGSAALGSLLAVGLSPQGPSLFAGFQDLMQLKAFSNAAIASLALCGALLVSAVVLAVDSD